MWILYIFVILFFIMWITTGFYISFANTAIKHVKNDSSSNSAYDWSLSAEITTWTLLCLAVLGAIAFGLFYVFGGEVLLAPEELMVVARPRKVFDLVVTISIIVLGFLLFVTGVCSVMTAIDLIKSPSFDPTNSDYSKGYKYAIISAVLSLTSLGALGVVYVSMKIYEHEKREKHRREFKTKLEASKEVKAAHKAPVHPQTIKQA